MTNTYTDAYTNTFVIHRREYEVTSLARFDSDTNEIVDDMELDDKAVEIANQMYRDDMGLVSPIDIKKYRAKVGLSQRELAQLVGWSSNTVALYETGAFPSESNNKILKAMICDDHFLTKVLIGDCSKLSDALINKIKDYLDSSNDDVIVQLRKAPTFSAVQLTNWFRVTNYFDGDKDENSEELTQMKVVKLLYFAFGRYAARTHAKLFNSRIIAMPYGPVVEEVHKKFNGCTGIVSSGLTDTDFEDYNQVQNDEEISALLSEILTDYGDKTASGLSKITHQDGSPWSLTNSFAVINPTLIAESFDRGVEN